jgi:hypothetical protein
MMDKNLTPVFSSTLCGVITGSHWTDSTLVSLPQIVDRLLMDLSDTLFSRLGTRYEFTLCANGLGRFGALDTFGIDRRGYYD